MMTMTEGSNYSTVSDGQLCFWQVFELMQEFKDRPADASGDRVFSASLDQSGADSLAIVVGAFPERIRQALLEYRARAAYQLRSLTGEYSDMTVEEQDAAISALEGQLNLDDLEIGDRIYLAMEMRRPLSLEINSSLRYLWDDVTADDGRRAAVEDFAEEAAPVLDSALAWLLPAMGSRLQLGRLVVPGRRAYLLAPGKAALAIPHLTMTAWPLGVSIGTWAEQPWEELGAALSAYPSHIADTDDLLAGPTRWMSMSLGEKDVVRKFLFAYCALEMLANKAVSRWRPILIEALGSEIPGAPVGELLWPTAQDDRYADRSLIFNFAAMATLVSRDSATADTVLFRMIAKARNSLAHGSSADLDKLPHGEA